MALLLALAAAAGYLGWKYALPWWKTKPPAASGGELQVHVLDVGPIDGDSILIVSPAGKTVLIDAGDLGKDKVVLDALKRYKIQQLDYFIATPDIDNASVASIDTIRAWACGERTTWPRTAPNAGTSST